MPDLRAVILCDFDGTITQVDTCQHVLDRLTDGEQWKAIESLWVGGKITARECLARQFSLVKASKAQVTKVLCEVIIDESFIKFIRFCGTKGIDLQILSDGFDYFIDSVLKRYHLPRMGYFSNKIRFRPNGHLALSFATRDNCCERCANDSVFCKSAVIRRKKKMYDFVIYVGNGRSDFCATKEADLVFAKEELAQHCKASGLDYIAYDDFCDVLKYLKKYWKMLGLRDSQRFEGDDRDRRDISR